MALAPGPETFTVEQVRQVCRNGQYVRGSSRQSKCDSLEYDSNHGLKFTRYFCRCLHASVQDPVSHLARIDESFASLHETSWDIPPGSEEYVVAFAFQLLSRLPARPPDILQSLTPDNSNNSALDGYLVHRWNEGCSPTCVSSTRWDHLQVVASVNTTIIRIALHEACSMHSKVRSGYPGGRTFLNATMALLEMAFQLSSEPGNTGREHSWTVVKAFLWTSWQRALMLSLWGVLEGQLRNGYQYESNKHLAIRGLTPFPPVFHQLTLQQLEERKKTPYMCSWANELLRTDRACVAMDLRRFHQSYNSLFGNRPARCKHGQRQCDGRSPESCQRFKGAIVVDQAAHDWKCLKECKRLFWDRPSFLNVSGPKAVCIALTDDKKLGFRRASNKTLAISHVWSHGQGGRPDGTGFNACLHRRYADLARSFECDSYWMDTPCIPSEKALRTECINNINRIFTESKVTLVCDRDLMSIDISYLTMELRESILATVLVCDWNLRAWTLLEAIRGRNNIHLLCAKNEVINFKETLKAVHEAGRIDLATLFLTTQHLMPHPPPDDWELFPGGGSVATDQDRKMEMGFVDVGEAVILLSHRHASRDQDDIVIWSLLVDEKAIKDPIQIWKDQLGTTIPTGLLLSSAPRIQGHRGLGWAPCCPTVRLPPKADSNRDKFYLAYEGADTMNGVMTPEGLRAKWLLHKFPSSPANSAPHLPRIAEISSRYLQNYTWGALLRPCSINGPRNIPARYRGNAQGPLLAICASTDGQGWEWKGVYDWGISDPLPDFEFTDLLLV